MDDPRSLKILYLSAECVPFAKTGGLADVAGALPKAVRGLGHDIRIDDAALRPGRDREIRARSCVDRVDVPMDERTEPAAVYEATHRQRAGQTPVLFVDSERYFDRQGIYMYPDDAERFIFFSRAGAGSLPRCSTGSPT